MISCCGEEETSVVKTSWTSDTDRSKPGEAYASGGEDNNFHDPMLFHDITQHCLFLLFYLKDYYLREQKLNNCAFNLSFSR